MSDVQMTAIDTLFISSVSSESIKPGGEFVVSEDQATRLEQAGLANRKEAKTAAPAPNKMADTPRNKSAAPAKREVKD